MIKRFMVGCATNWRSGLVVALLASGLQLQGCADSGSNPATRVPATKATDEFASGHIVVKFEPTLTAVSRQALAAEVGALDVSRPSYANFWYVKLPEGADPHVAAARLNARPGVIYAEADPLFRTLMRPNDEYYQYQWHFQRIGMERAWDVNPGGDSSVVVAVLDSGVAYADGTLYTPFGYLRFKQAPDLNGVNFVDPYDFLWDSSRPFDLDGHGTHVTGTIAQRTNNDQGVAGIAFNASIMPVKVIAGQAALDLILGAPAPYGASTTARGINYAVEHGANVINMSLGSTHESIATREALENAVSRGVFVAIAAGNSAEEGNPVEYPAKYAESIEGAMAVGAVGYDLTRASYSNTHSYVEIAAPGGDTTMDRNHDGFGDGVLQQTYACPIQSIADIGCYDEFDYVFMDGTSMASPHVAGVAALLYSQGITSPAAIEAAIERFAKDIPPSGRDDQTGYGLINPLGSLLGLGLAR